MATRSMPIVVVPARVDGDLELGADAVVRRDEDRILEAGAFQIEQAAEAAEVRVGAGPARRFGQRLDRRDQRVAGIDVDAGITVCEGRAGLGLGCCFDAWGVSGGPGRGGHRL